MHEPEFKVVCGENSQYISERDVEWVTALVREGTQRLRTIPKTKQSSFYFPVSYNGHYAATEICVSPVIGGTTRNPFYKPSLRYTPCCTVAQAGKFIKLAQEVYNTYIRPIQWIFDDDCCEACPPVSTSGSCWQKTQLGFDWLVGSGQRNENDIGGSTVISENRADPDASSLEPVHPQRSLALTCRPTKRRRTTESKVNDNDSSRRTAEERIAESLKKKVISGLKRIQGGDGALNKEGIEVVVSKCRSDAGHIAERSAELEDAFWASGNSAHANGKVSWWTGWFYASCVRLVRRHMGYKVHSDDKKDQWAVAARMVNLVVNSLFDKEPAAVAVWAAFAVHKHTLAEAAKLKEEGRSDVVKLLVEKLRKSELTQPPTSYGIPHPGVVISCAWNKPYANICRILGLDNLKELDLLPESVMQVSFGNILNAWSAANTARVAPKGATFVEQRQEQTSNNTPMRSGKEQDCRRPNAASNKAFEPRQDDLEPGARFRDGAESGTGACPLHGPVQTCHSNGGRGLTDDQTPVGDFNCVDGMCGGSNGAIGGGIQGSASTHLVPPGSANIPNSQMLTGPSPTASYNSPTESNSNNGDPNWAVSELGVNMLGGEGNIYDWGVSIDVSEFVSEKFDGYSIFNV